MTETEEIKVAPLTDEELGELEDKIRRYKEINEELDVLTSEKKKIATVVTDVMKEHKLSQLLVGEGSDALSATYTQKTTFKYTNEKSIIKYLKDNGKDSYLETTVVAPTLNEDLKTDGNLLIEALKPYYEKNISYQLLIMLKSDYDKNVAPKKKKKDS